MFSERQNFFAVTLSLSLIVSASVALPVFAGWQDTSKINQWFESQKGRKYEMEKPGVMQKAPERMQVPGKIQTPGKLQVPRGIKAINVVDTTRCEHRFVVGADTLFAFDKWTLTPQAEETLKVLGPMILKEGNHPVTVEGHTDAIGTVDYNQTLSEKRAATVNAWLEAHEFLVAPAVCKGYGKLNPVAPNINKDGSDNPVGRQKNRRVEIVVDTCNTIEPVAKKEPAPAATVTTTTTTAPAAGATTTTTTPATGVTTTTTAPTAPAGATTPATGVTTTTTAPAVGATTTSTTPAATATPPAVTTTTTTSSTPGASKESSPEATGTSVTTSTSTSTSTSTPATTDGAATTTPTTTTAPPTK